jgi:diguanylate cyclase (GGDEF)-like protein
MMSAAAALAVGSLVTMMVVAPIFALFHRRTRRAKAVADHLSAENDRLLQASRIEAITDPLTGLGNRRAFTLDLDEMRASCNDGEELVLAVFDLDGFKQYNDTFGHAAGDELLVRLALGLKNTIAGMAKAYRMGGDEFCLLARSIRVKNGSRLVHLAVAALSETGDGWRIGCSWGLAWMPSEAKDASEALRIADERMYAQKASWSPASHQATAALLQVLSEQDGELCSHTNRVADLSTATAQLLGLPQHEIIRVGLAAQLHDIGKTAIPDSILSKPGPLNDAELSFLRRHTLIGERIIKAAPSLSHMTSIVRSSHERFDGTGYPDGLSGTDIPLGARIIAVCDAYDAMIAARPYRKPTTVPAAITELRRCAGTHFDPDAVSRSQPSS